MKRALIILSMVTALLYGIESNETIGFSHYKPLLDVTHNANQYILTWSKIPYFAYYEVEVLNRGPGLARSAVPAYRVVKYRTLTNTLKIEQDFPQNTYIRVSAHTLFHKPLGLYSNSVPTSDTISDIPIEDQANSKPVSTIDYPSNNPAPNIALLRWTIVPGAVYYEIEFLSAPAENPNDIAPSSHRIFSSMEVFVNGYSVDFSKSPTNHLYWRVRSLDYNGNPIGVFSDCNELFINHKLPQILKPISNTGYKETNTPMPIYPVYSWIPIAGAVNYEVEVTKEAPENPGGIQSSRHQIRRQLVHGGSDCYDEEPLMTPGTYYWRVRGLDSDGKPVGVFSDAEAFTVDLTVGNYAATLGDSITHGGGAISYSPADVEYDFQTYLSFPTLNLGKSGDTSETMLARFDQDVLPCHPKFLIIMGGSNSLRGGTSAAQVIGELTAMRDKCIANGIRPIFLTLPPINPISIHHAFDEDTIPDWQDSFSSVNSFIRKQPYFIDLEPYFMDENHELPLHYATDGLHLDIEGKKLMALIINANWARVTR